MIVAKIQDKEKYKWHPCYYECMKCQYPQDDEVPFGWWLEWLDKYGNIELARMKEDAYDHFFPKQKIIESEEDIVAWRYSTKLDDKENNK